MKRIIYFTSLIIVSLITLIIIILSTTGYETDKFNNLIENNIKKQNQSFLINLKKVKFKIDIKNISLFIETKNPKVSYNDLIIPIKNIKVYLNFVSVIKSNARINQINIETKEINVDQFKKILIKTKPSNLNSFIINKVESGILKANFELFFVDNIKLKNFIAKGQVKNMNAALNDEIKINNTYFEFFSDKTDTIIKKISADVSGISISDGSLRVEKEKNINIKSDFVTKISINEKNANLYSNYLQNFKFLKENLVLNGTIKHNLIIDFDETFKLLEYSVKSKGKINNLKLSLRDSFKSELLNQDLSNFFFNINEFDLRMGSDNKNFIKASGEYSYDEINFQLFEIENRFFKDNLNTKLSFDFLDQLNIDFINYKKDKKTKAKIDLNFQSSKKSFHLKKLNYFENNNIIKLKDLKIKSNNLISLKEIKVKTFQNKDLKNDFNFKFGKKILINGSKYDATNLNKILNENNKNDFLKKINKKIEINFQNVETPLSKKLKNFILIGNITKGEFTKISSKGDFGNNKFLDISLKSDKKNKKKYLEIYSDLPQPLLADYKFFKGVTDGTLTFSSIFDENLSNSKLVIENFKIINAPAVVKLLSLADFGGLADLAEGDGLSFEKLEINMNKNKENFLKLDELYAVGPSISVLMEGYQDANGLTSLRGTLVPAKNLNNFLAKIPVIGDIIIPKDIGEGLFGVSFKMKGPPGKIKTSINPIKTLTPRFITKALEKSKKPK